MGIYTQQLPQLAGRQCITDAGLETELCFKHQIDLPEFAAYDLLRQPAGCQLLFDYYATYVELAKRYQQGVVLETATWRANRDWGRKIGDSPEVLEALNIKAVQLLEQVRKTHGGEQLPVVISGNLGPRGDGYSPAAMMSAVEAQDYHRKQITTFTNTNVDMLAALTLNYVEEAVGVVLAANETSLPLCIAFTVETDGNLPTGQSLESAIETVDQQTDGGPDYYMINCAHPTHFDHLFKTSDQWLQRVKGLRGNASCLSHAELDECETLDEGNPDRFGIEVAELKAMAPQLTVLGGCCGTDHRHIEQICRNLLAMN